MSQKRHMGNNDGDNKEASLTLSFLPTDIRQGEIYPHSPLSVLGLLAQTSREYEADTAFLRLLTSTVYAEPESYRQKDATRLAAIAILKRHPELLFREGKLTKDHFKRKIKASPYQLFLGAGDIWALKQVHEEIIAKIENQEARIAAEAKTKAAFHTQFPDYKGGWPLDPNMPEEALYDERNKKQLEQVSVQLKVIVEKITADPCTNGQATKAETIDALAGLYQIFAPKKGEIIKTGLHFPLGILQQIGKAYESQFQPWTDRQLSVFSRSVIGIALSALTAVDGQCTKSGLVSLNIEKGPDRRDGLFCRHPRGIPEDKTPLIGRLGHTMFVDPYDGSSCFTSSTPGSFDWYNQYGLDPSTDPCFELWFVASMSDPLEKLWRTKAGAYGSFYLAQHKEINKQSQSP